MSGPFQVTATKTAVALFCETLVQHTCAHVSCCLDVTTLSDEQRAPRVSLSFLNVVGFCAGWALCGHDPQELPRLLEEEAKAQEAACKPGSSGPNPGAAAEGISLRDRVIAGTQCKRLIEYGRLKWIERQGECAVSEVIPYVDASVSGENRLIVVRFR